ncbi:unnamed protein product [Caenorhabditis brenneri]
MISQHRLSKFEKEMKKEEKKMQEELLKQEDECAGLDLELVEKFEVVDKPGHDSGDEYYSGDEYESASEGHGEPCLQDRSDKENVDSDNEENHTNDQKSLVYWRINFRDRHRVNSDTILVDSTTPPSELSSDPFCSFGRGPNGELQARVFQFLHELKESSYKNKYNLRLGDYKLTFSERDDSILIRSATEATLHMGTSSNSLIRNGNMAMEELRKMVGMNLRVTKSVFVSNRSQQMGEMDLTKCVNTIAAENLTIFMDSYENIVQIIKLHRPELKKFTLRCEEDSFSGILELEQIRNCPRLKLEGTSGTTDEQLATIQASNFELTSESITMEGINAYLKNRVAAGIPENFYVCVKCRGVWETENVLEGLDATEYETEAAYARVK